MDRERVLMLLKSKLCNICTVVDIPLGTYEYNGYKLQYDSRLVILNGEKFVCSISYTQIDDVYVVLRYNEQQICNELYEMICYEISK